MTLIVVEDIQKDMLQEAVGDALYDLLLSYIEDGDLWEVEVLLTLYGWEIDIEYRPEFEVEDPKESEDLGGPLLHAKEESWWIGMTEKTFEIEIL